MTTTTIDIAGLEGGHVTLTPERSATWTRGSRVGCCAPAIRAGTMPSGSGTPWRPRSALIVQPASANDVAAAVGFARNHGLLLSIKGGGHNIAGTALADGGLTLDMSRLRGIVVDPAARPPPSRPAACSARSTTRPSGTAWPRRWASSPRSAWPG